MLELQEFAVEYNSRLVLTGDTKQHHSVERGDALRILERSGVVAQAELTKIRRQAIPELRAAIEDLSKGRTGEGFDKLDKFGVILEKGRTALIVESHNFAVDPMPHLVLRRTERGVPSSRCSPVRHKKVLLSECLKEAQ